MLDFNNESMSFEGFQLISWIPNQLKNSDRWQGIRFACCLHYWIHCIYRNHGEQQINWALMLNKGNQSHLNYSWNSPTPPSGMIAHMFTVVHIHTVSLYAHLHRNNLKLLIHIKADWMKPKWSVSNT